MTHLKAIALILISLIFAIQTGLVSADEVTIGHQGFRETIIDGNFLVLNISSNDPDFELPPEIFENRLGYTKLTIRSGVNFINLPSTVGLMSDVREFQWRYNEFSFGDNEAVFTATDPAITLPSEMRPDDHWKKSSFTMCMSQICQFHLLS